MDFADGMGSLAAQSASFQRVYLHLRVIYLMRINTCVQVVLYSNFFAKKKLVTISF